MRARDVMTKVVVSVSPETPTRSVAKLLLEKGISAMPVVDAGGAPIGMVSEGDLIGRDVSERAARRDWWLAMLAEGSDLAQASVDRVKAADRPVREVMAAPVITIEEDAAVQAIAGLLEEHRIKRVPVVREGRIIGLISRADLIRSLARTSEPPSASPASASAFGRFLSAVDATFHHDAPNTAAPPVIQPDKFSATDFRQSMDAFEHAKAAQKSEALRVDAEARSHMVKELLREHVADGRWREMLTAAHDAAGRGEKQYLLLRFPSQLCADAGRKINAEEADWPGTLRGEPAELYLQWERELRAVGFRIAARVLDFPGGMPGDVGLFLAWGA